MKLRRRRDLVAARRDRRRGARGERDEGRDDDGLAGDAAALRRVGRDERLLPVGFKARSARLVHSSLVLGYHPQLLVCKGQRPVPASQYELPCFRKLPREWKFPEISEISTPLDFVSWKLLNYKNTRMHQKARAPRGSNQPKALHDTYGTPERSKLDVAKGPDFPTTDR